MPEAERHILYRDALVLVLNKPAGLATHRGPATPDSVEDWLPDLRQGYKELPQPAHRLDRDTAGCLVLGRNERALRRLGRAFAEGRVDKTYWAVCHNAPADESGMIDAPLVKRSTRQAGWSMAVDAKHGQPAQTGWRVLGRGILGQRPGTRPPAAEPICWMEFQPQTGRTHQIRVHAAHLGCPLLGDDRYGPAATGGLPLHLLARSIALPALTEGGHPITVTAPVPDHMRAALAACDWPGDTR